MSFPDFRAHIDELADELFKRQIKATATGQPIALDPSELVRPTLELVKRQDVNDVQLSQAKHAYEHSYKMARQKAKKLGNRILQKMGRGQWPLPLELDDAIHACDHEYYPLRHMTALTYSDHLDKQHRQAKHELDRVDEAVANKSALMTIWGNRMLGEVVGEQPPIFE